MWEIRLQGHIRRSTGGDALSRGDRLTQSSLAKHRLCFDRNNFEYCSVENVLLAWVLSWFLKNCLARESVVVRTAHQCVQYYLLPTCKEERKKGEQQVLPLKTIYWSGWPRRQIWGKGMVEVQYWANGYSLLLLNNKSINISDLIFSIRVTLG
jgi:hypothetical protein